MNRSFRLSVVFLLILFSARAVAQSPGFGDEDIVQPQDYSGYCLKDWKGEDSCFKGSRDPWVGPKLVPAVVQILARESRNEQPIEYRHVCGAVLIAPDWALTAANCVSDSRVARRYEVGIGFSDRENGGATDAGVTLRLRQIVIHPEYLDKKINLALVRFEADERVHIANPTYSPIVDFETRKTAQLVFPRPPGATFPLRDAADIRFADLHSGEAPAPFHANSVLFRWSRLSDGRMHLLKTPLFQLTTDLCNQQTGVEPVVEGVSFCGLSHNRPLCPSDSGAPVMGGIESGRYNSSVGEDGGMPHAMLVAAVTSWDSDECATPGEPGRFTLVKPHAKWIRTVVKESYDKRKAESQRIYDPALWGGARRN